MMFKSLGGKLPQRATKYSAGFDVFANEDVVIGAGETKLVGLGISIDLEGMYPNGNNQNILDYYYFALYLRSSLGAKGLILPNGVGIIDIDYTGEIKMIIHNPVRPLKAVMDDEHTSTIFFGEKFAINRGDKIGQLILMRHEGYLLPSEYTLDNERVGGFGSTNNQTTTNRERI